jgi:hypothetical protein
MSGEPESLGDVKGLTAFDVAGPGWNRFSVNISVNAERESVGEVEEWWKEDCVAEGGGIVAEMGLWMIDSNPAGVVGAVDVGDIHSEG